MPEYETTVETPDGAMDAFVARPSAAAPAVIIYMDVWGLRQELFDIAKRVAKEGYYCIIPNFYYRQGKVRFEFRNEQMQTVSMTKLPAEAREQVARQTRQLSDAMVIEDTRAVLRFFMSEEVVAGPVGAIGFCMGGRHAMCAAAHCPEMQATASLHGTRLVLDTPLSPHRFADKFRGEIYCGFAEHDDLAPPETIAALTKALGDRPNVKYSSIVHPGTVHGYSLPDRDVHDKAAAERDWEKILAMFKQRLLNS